MTTKLSISFVPSTVQTKPFAGQKPGTSGLRKRVPEFQQPNYIENFVQCVLDGGLGEAKRGAVLVVGGDGNFLCPQAVNLVIKIAAANGVSKLIIGRDGFLSTPAVSHLIRKGDNGRKINGGIILTASHNRGGTINDFGIKFNCENGGPAPDSVTERIYQLSTNIAEFRICLNLDIDFGQIGTTMATIEGVGQFVVQVIDSVQDYADYLEKIFDFPKIRSLLTGGMANGRPFRLLVDSMHGVTGPYVSTIFVDRLGAPAQSCLRTVLKPDFGGDHPDPNLTYAKGLVDQMALGEHDIGAAFDVDGVRHFSRDLYMIFGRNAFVKSSDSLAVIAANLDCIPYFKNKTTIGDARSMPTACAVDRAVKVRGRPYLDRAAKLRGRQLPLCGEESFGTGLDRIRETDVLWALLAWLQVLAHKNGTKSVEQLVDEHRCAKSCGVSLMVNEEEQVTFPQRKINRDGYIKAQFFLSSPSSESPSPSPKRKKDKTYKPPSGGRRCKKLADEVVDDSLDQMGLMEQMEVERAGSGLEDGSVGPEGWEAQMAAVLEEDSIIVQQMGSKNDSDLVNFVMENFTAALEEQQNDNAQHEEKSVLDRCNGIMGYLAAIPMLINRLRDAAVFLFYSVSHTSVLLGRHAKTVTCGLHRAERSTLTAQHTNFTEADFYIALQEVNLLTDQQMWDNGYPRWAETSAAAADEAMDDEQGQGLDTDDPPRDGKRRVEIRQSELDAGKSRIPFVDDSVLSRVCDRCGKEYRLTNEGDYAAGASSDQCIFHWGRAWKKRVFGTVESRYNCCDQPLTVQGCDVAPHHITQTQRLSTLRCYAETPRPFGVGDPRSKKVYALDCEMVYTVWGPEVARFSVVDITGDLILDLIIRPEHRIVDCNTKFSGLKPEQVMAGECDLNEVAQLVQPILVNASHQQMAEPFCADGTNNLQFLNGCVSALGQPLPPLCLIVVSIDHRPAQPTPAGPLAVTNCVLRTGDGHRVEASGWQAHAGALAALCVGTAYWFTNCVTRAKYQRLDCWYRIGVGGPNALVVPHVAPESPANIPPMVPVQVGAGRDAVRVPTNVTNAVDERADADLDNNNNDNVGLESRPSPCASRTAGARPTQRRAAEPAGRPIGECFVIERSTSMRNVPRNTRGEICELRFLPLEEAQRPDLLMEAIVQQLLDRVLAGHPRPSMVGLQLHPPGFDRPYVIGLRPPEQNNAAALAAAIERLNEQSAAGIDLLAGTTVTKVLAVWPLDSIRADPQRGGACDRDVEHHVSNTVQSLVRIHNPNDRLCLARAVLLGMHDRETRMAGGGGKAAFNLFASRQDQHGPAAAQMLTRAGIAANRDMYTLDDVQRLQQWLNNQHGVGQIRLAVFEKEQEYRIVFKGDGFAARFNLCLVLERGHFNYIGRVEQLFDVPNYCIDCERRADARYHAFGCKVVCRLCLRYGPGYPCQTEQLPNGGSSARKCAECLFIFPNGGCYDYHLSNHAPAPMDGRGQRQRRPICQWRRVCRACGRIAYVATHQCPHDQPADDGICRRCNGPHTVDEPCYIQPIDDGSVRQRASIAVDNDDSDDDDDDEELPLRLCFFDAETSQDTPLQLNNRTVQKHVPLLIVAEVICERCLQAGISVNDGLGRRAPGCVCMTGMVRGQLFRQWSSPPFANAPGDNSASPVGAPAFNQRRFFFHSFDNDGNDPVDQFLDFLLQHGPKKAHTVCIAHNGGKYDFHLVLEALHRRNRPPKHLCTTGLKIYSMRLSGRNQRRITFKDSINYFFCALDALVKSFQVPEHLATVKPFFPYLYIRRQHLSQRLNGLPAQQFYAPDTMKAEKRAQFLRWHADNNGNGFQLREQLIMYCVNDVAILRESVIRFRQLIADNTQGLDPFLHASTAAGLALATFRRCFLPANRLVHSPEGGYLRGRRASAESQRYIRFFELEHPEAQVQCASWSVGEAHIEDSGYRVDGFWRREAPLRPLAIEWLGCYYHGCPVCFPDRQQQLAAGRTAEDLYERTERRLFELENDHGCEIHKVWACQWAERLRHDPDLKRRYDAVFVPCPLDPRNDALRGGRTEPFKLHHVCSDDEEIVCIDIVSLYPYVMKANRFPVGNPRVLTREVLLRPPTAPLPWNAPENNIFRGLLLVRVLAPRNIRVPLLGYRTKDGRFTFPLCAWCADRRQQRPCRHDDDKRSWVTAYTHVELNKALQLGYVVTDLFEVWDYDEWDGTLFSSYVNTFVGLKVQATGWPEGCVTDEQHQAFVDDFERTEGIRLDSTKMEFNPGLRLIAKTLANSLWGKLAQRVGQTEIRYTRTPAEFHALLDDPTVDKLDFVHVSEHMDRCVVRKRPEFARAPPTNCLPVAAFVTSYGRLHLYDYMEQVSAIDGAELLYCDTDSIYYVNKMGGPCVAEGEALGQMKRELTDRRIVEFVAGGPKNYGIRHTARDGMDERANLKIRSFRLSYTAQQLLTFEAMKDLTLATYNIDGPIDDALDNDDLYVYGGGEHRAIRVNFPQIDRNVYADLYTHEAHKDYRPFYAKGRVRPGMQTRPFGYLEDDGQPNEGQRTHRRKRNFVEQDPTQPGHSRWF